MGKPKIFKLKFPDRNPNYSHISFLTSLSCILFFLIPSSTFWPLKPEKKNVFYPFIAAILIGKSFFICSSMVLVMINAYN